MARNEQTRYEKIDSWIGRSLVMGLLVSIGVMALGLGAAALRGGNTGTVLPLSRILPELARGSPPAILDTGILLLFATPFAGVVVALVGFATVRNARFVAITTALLLLLILGFIVALR